MPTFPWRKKDKKAAGTNDEHKERNGLFILEHCGSDVEHAVDIVAVHGLEGHWDLTWTDASNKKNWLRDFLPQQLRDGGVPARIMSFGYDSRTAFTKAETDIDDAATDLLGRMKDNRNSPQEKSRPLVFIAHSLGGIVVKKAMICAHERSTYFGSLLDQIFGTVLMGVPHRGSDTAYWAHFAAMILRSGQLGLGTNTNFVKSLQKNSKTFADISTQWVDRAERLLIRTFYERDTTLNSVIVDKDSAVLNRSNELAYPIQANHQELCKFARADSQKYAPVWGAVKEICQGALPKPATDPGNVHWVGLRSLNSLFTGRDDLVQEIATALLSSETVVEAGKVRCYAITGMGGQGKSELSLKVAHTVKSKFWGIFWVDLATASTAKASYSLVAKCLRVSAETMEEGRDALANQQHRWLLVLDNADDLNTDYAPYLPSSEFGTVIFTSRNPDCRPYRTLGSRALEGLAPAHAQRLLLKAANIDSDQTAQHEEAAEGIVRMLRYHPLALIQAGTYVSRGHCTLAQYPKVYERQRQRLLTFRPSQEHSRYRDVYATFEASAKTLNADALQLLLMLAACSPSRLPLSWFKAGWSRAKAVPAEMEEDAQDENVLLLTPWHANHLPPLMEVGSHAWDPFRLNKTVRQLEDSALMSKDESNGHTSVSMHPLIHAWARDRQSKEEQHASWLQMGCLAALSSKDGTFCRKNERQLQPHVDALTEWEVDTIFGVEASGLVARVLVNCGWLLHQMRSDMKLLILVRKILERLGLKQDQVEGEWVGLYDLAARNLDHCGKARDAIPLMEQIVKIREQSLAEDHPNRLASQYALAGAYQANGQVKETIVILEKVVKIQEQSLAEDHLNRLASQHELAGAYQANGQVKEAIVILEKVVKIQEQSLAEDHPNRLASQHALAGAYQANGQVKEAIVIQEKVVKIQEQSLAEDHPDRLALQYLLVGVYEANGQVKEAIVILEKVVKIQEQSLVEDHSDRLASQYELARAYQANGQVKEAIVILEKVVKIQEQSLPEDHPSRLASQHTLAGAYQANGQVQKAIVILEKVVKIQQQSLAEDHPNRLASQHELARAYQANGQVKETIVILEKVVKIREQSLAEDHPSRLASQHNMAICLWKLGSHQLHWRR